VSNFNNVISSIFVKSNKIFLFLRDLKVLPFVGYFSEKTFSFDVFSVIGFVGY
jgi:hypothetical protein